MKERMSFDNLNVCNRVRERREGAGEMQTATQELGLYFYLLEYIMPSTVALGKC